MTRDGFKPIKNLFAFWAYAGFPYILGGPVTAINDQGHVQIGTYGGAVFKPIKLVPLKAGQELLKRLEALRQEHHDAEQAFTDEWHGRVAQLFPEVAK